MKKILNYFVVSLFLISFFPINTFADTLFSGGSGAPGDPFQISTCQQLQNINLSDLSLYYSLTQDVDCSTTQTWNEDSENLGTYFGFSPIGFDTEFSGVFDGQNHIISNLYINLPNSSRASLFAYVHSGSLKNVGLKNVNITGKYYAGALAGDISSSTISRAFTTGTVSVAGDSGNYLGGLVGYSYKSHIENSYSSAVIHGYDNVGGLVGKTTQNGDFTSVVNSYATGDVYGHNYVGGLIGNVDQDVVSNSFSTGKVTGSGDYIGGLFGRADADYVSNCGWFSQSGGVLNSVGLGDATSTYNIKVGGGEGFIDGDYSWFYNKNRAIYTTINNEPSWDFSTPIWYEYTNNYPSFVAQTTSPTQKTKVSRGSGTSVVDRVRNLISMGNVKLAEELMDKWPQQFPNRNISIKKTEAVQAPVSTTVNQIFINDLSLGSKNTDVLRLQKFLNTRGFFVNIIGPGSLGSETTLFGPATKAALIKFQESNRDTILKPLNLIRGTGTFGKVTKDYVNSLLLK